MVDNDDLTLVLNQQGPQVLVSNANQAPGVISSATSNPVAAVQDQVSGAVVVVGTPGPAGPPGPAGGGSSAVFIQDSAPVVGSGDYMWVQTNYPTPGNFTIWVFF